MNATLRSRGVSGLLLPRVWCVLVFAALPGLGCAVLNHNLRAVEPGAFYRSGQMPAGTLARTLRRHGIRTVISLRGAAPGEDWFRDEQAACAAQGVAHHSLGWSKNALPDPESLHVFMDLCRESEAPVLVHCQGGVHRSGVASAIFVLLHDGSISDAREELGLFFGGAPIGRLLDLYEGSGLTFADWASREFPRIYERETGGASLPCPRVPCREV